MIVDDSIQLSLTFIVRKAIRLQAAPPAVRGGSKHTEVAACANFEKDGFEYPPVVPRILKWNFFSAHRNTRQWMRRAMPI
jgi:hypothetical protein